MSDDKKRDEGRGAMSEEDSRAVKIEVRDADREDREAAEAAGTPGEPAVTAGPEEGDSTGVSPEELAAGDGEPSVARDPEPGEDEAAFDEGVELSLMEALEARLEAVSAEKEALRQEAEIAGRRLEEAEKKALLLQADFQNFRRRKNQEVERLQDEKAQSILLKALPVLDDINRGLKHIEKDQTLEGVLEGLDLIRQKFEVFLAGQGVQRIEAEGKPFDPNLHDAMVRVPIPEGLRDDDVVDVFEDGYLYGERVLRPSKVSVAKTEAEE